MAWLAFGTTTRELRDGEVVVGSGAEADWRVSTADLMPRHFVVDVRGSEAQVRPSSADNVLVVNGAQITTGPHTLRNGDIVLAGSGWFAFTLDAPGSAAVAEPSVSPGYLVDDQLKVAHPLSNRSTPIGRDASNAIVVRDPTASRFHAEVRREAGGFALHSMGAHGTALNDKPLVTPCLLAEGDMVEIAFTTLRFTTQPPGRDVKLATPHSTRNDESTRKPTLAVSADQVAVNDDNPAGRQSRRLQLLVGLVILAGAMWWWMASR